MTFPADFTSTTFADGEQVDNTKLFTRVLSWLNAFKAMVFGLGQGYEASAVGSGSTTLPTAATPVAGNATVTFVVPAGGRRYRIYAAANFAMLGGTNGRYTIASGYNSGSTPAIGSFVGVSQARPVVITITGATNSVGQDAEGDIFLPAGTYTAYPSLNRTTGGGATDVAGSQYVVVTDIGLT